MSHFMFDITITLEKWPHVVSGVMFKSQFGVLLVFHSIVRELVKHSLLQSVHMLMNISLKV